MPASSKVVGDASEASVLAHFVRKGTPVLIPFGDNQRYDLVLEERGAFVRAQVKTGRLTDGSVAFKTSSVNGFTGKRTGYAGSIDVFLVYCPETNCVYRVPVGECGRSVMHLRVDPISAFVSKSRIRWATDYLA